MVYYIKREEHEADRVHEVEIAGGYEELIVIDKLYGPHVYHDLNIVLDKETGEWVVWVQETGEVKRLKGVVSSELLDG